MEVLDFMAKKKKEPEKPTPKSKKSDLELHEVCFYFSPDPTIDPYRIIMHLKGEDPKVFIQKAHTFGYIFSDSVNSSETILINTYNANMITVNPKTEEKWKTK
jgi:hypothetical protein